MIMISFYRGRSLVWGLGFAIVERAPGAVRPTGGARWRSTCTHPIRPSYTRLGLRFFQATEVPKLMQRQESAAGTAISAFAGIYRRLCRCRGNSALAGGDAVCKVGRGSARGTGWRPLAETVARSQVGQSGIKHRRFSARAQHDAKLPSVPRQHAAAASKAVLGFRQFGGGSKKGLRIVDFY